LQKLLLTSLIASALCYGITSIATDITLLYIAQLPTLAQHAVLSARAHISYTSKDAELTSMLGYISAAYGIGVVIGPALGGELANRSLFLAAGLAAVGSLLSAVLLWLWLPEAAPHKEVGAKKEGKTGFASNANLIAHSKTLVYLLAVCNGGDIHCLAMLQTSHTVASPTFAFWLASSCAQWHSIRIRRSEYCTSLRALCSTVHFDWWYLTALISVQRALDIS
jgi:MFS family permease